MRLPPLTTRRRLLNAGRVVLILGLAGLSWEGFWWSRQYSTLSGPMGFEVRQPAAVIGALLLLTAAFLTARAPWPRSLRRGLLFWSSAVLLAGGLAAAESSRGDIVGYLTLGDGSRDYEDPLLPPAPLCEVAFYGTVSLLALSAVLVRKRKQANQNDLRPINPPPHAATTPPHP